MDWFWNFYAKVYDCLNYLLPYQELLERVVAALCAKKGELKILDAGCGTGNFANALRARSRPNIALDGVDGSWAMLKRAKKKTHTRARYVRADLNRSLPYADGSFDGVVSLNVLYALRDPSSVVQEFWRVLKFGGILVVANPRKNASPLDILRAHVRMLIGMFTSGDRRKSFLASARTVLFLPQIFLIIILNLLIIKKRASGNRYHFFDAESLKSMLERNGFRALRSELAYGGTDVFIVAEKMPRTSRDSGSPVTIEVARTGEDLAAAYRLRYSVYCEEMHSLDSAVYPNREESDKFDSCAIHFLARHNGEAVGCIRLLPDCGRGFLLEEQFAFPPELEKVRDRTVEISRWIVDPAWRGTGLWFDLADYAVRWSMERGYRCWIMVAQEKLWKGLEKRGWSVARWEDYQEYHHTLSSPGALAPPYS